MVPTKSRRIPVGLLALAALSMGLLSVARTQEGGKGKSASDRFQGSWEVVSGIKGGEQLPEEISKTIKITFKGDKLEIEIAGQSKGGSFKVDASKKPAAIDLTADDKTAEGIYTFEGKTLKLCVADPGNARPTEFKAEAGSQNTLVILKRSGGDEKKEDDKKGTKKAGKGNLDGAWRVVAAEKGGEKLPDEIVKSIKLSVEGENMTLVILGETKKGSLKIDRTKKPMTIDLTMDNMTAEGIFVLEGGKLKICASEPGQGRPKEFKAEAGSQSMLVILERDTDAEKKPEPKKDAPKKGVREVQAPDAVAVAQPARGKADRDQIQGLWRVESITERGKAAPAEEARTVTVAIKGDGLTISKGGETKKGTFKLDPDKNPKQIDVTIEGEDKQGAGIYKLEGATLTVCLAIGDAARPAKFASDEGSSTVLVVLKRQKAEKRPAKDGAKDGARDGARDRAVEAELRQALERLRQELERTREELRAVQDQLAEARASERQARGRAEEALRLEARARAEAEAQARQEQLAARNATAAQGAGTRRASENNLKQIGLAMHTYHDANKSFPANAIYSKDGKALLSWRVAILPYIEQNQLYQQFKLDEPWDSEHNKKLLEKMPQLYAPVGVDTKERYTTFYQVFTGPSTLFEGNRGARLTSVTDGTSNTILAVEGGRPVPWTKPDDTQYDKTTNLKTLGGLFREGFNILMADGSVRWVRRGFDEQILRGAITRNGGEVIDVNKLDN